VSRDRPVVAFCGKGGVGKTVVSALVARALLDSGTSPILLVDADPMGGLIAAIGEEVATSLGEIRAKVIDAVSRKEGGKEWVARRLDYLLLESLTERDEYSLLSIGRSREKGCFCPVNRLLREALETLVDPFRAVLVDAEAGLEQISRQVTKNVTEVVVVVDGSRRALSALQQIAELVPGERLSVVANRGARTPETHDLPPGTKTLGVLPEDELVRKADIEGGSLWELPAARSPAVTAAREVAARLLP